MLVILAEGALLSTRLERVDSFISDSVMSQDLVSQLAKAKELVKNQKREEAAAVLRSVIDSKHRTCSSYLGACVKMSD